MRKTPNNRLLAKLRKLRQAVELYTDARLRSSMVSELDRLIFALSELRQRVGSGTTGEESASVLTSLGEVVTFLERAKEDDLFGIVCLEGLGRRKPDIDRAQIPPNLSNQQIQELLQRDLSRLELEEIAKQRSISVSKRSKTDLRSAILAFLERQESYEHLHA